MFGRSWRGSLVRDGEVGDVKARIRERGRSAVLSIQENRISKTR